MDGCGKGSGITLNGYKELLGVCSMPNGVMSIGEKQTAKGIRFRLQVECLLKIYLRICGRRRSNYNPVIMNGNGTQCVDAPQDRVLINPGAGQN